MKIKEYIQNAKFSKILAMCLRHSMKAYKMQQQRTFKWLQIVSHAFFFLLIPFNFPKPIINLFHLVFFLPMEKKKLLLEETILLIICFWVGNSLLYVANSKKEKSCKYWEFISNKIFVIIIRKELRGFGSTIRIMAALLSIHDLKRKS